MRPDAKFNLGLHEQQKRVINGTRPSPLMINRDSHSIRKPSSETTKPHKPQRDPIIIYTQSPKVIHTKARDFMALVQRLTGMSRSKDDIVSAAAAATENFGSYLSDDGSNHTSIKQLEQKHWKQGAGSDGDETSSAFRDDEEAYVKCGASVEHSPYMTFADVPLFTPNSSDFFCSSRPAYKYSDSNSPYGILGSLISPSGLEFIKELPEY